MSTWEDVRVLRKEAAELRRWAPSLPLARRGPPMAAAARLDAAAAVLEEQLRQIPTQNSVLRRVR